MEIFKEILLNRTEFEDDKPSFLQFLNLKFKKSKNILFKIEKLLIKTTLEASSKGKKKENLNFLERQLFSQKHFIRKALKLAAGLDESLIVYKSQVKGLYHLVYKSY